jgi:hypothetical protein
MERLCSRNAIEARATLRYKLKWTCFERKENKLFKLKKKIKNNKHDIEIKFVQIK